MDEHNIGSRHASNIGASFNECRQARCGEPLEKHTAWGARAGRARAFPEVANTCGLAVQCSLVAPEVRHEPQERRGLGEEPLHDGSS